MLYPALENIAVTRMAHRISGGINRLDSAAPYELSDCENLSSCEYPSLVSGKGRTLLRTLQNPLGLYSKDSLVFVDGTRLYINNTEVAGVTLDSSTNKSFVGMGAYLLIFPDKYYINTSDISDRGYIERTNTVATAAFAPCDSSGVPITQTASATAPQNPASGAYWLDTSQTPHTLMCYASQSAQWVPVTNPLFCIEASGIGDGFSVGDGVSVTGFDGSYVVRLSENGKIVLSGSLDSAYTAQNVTVCRKLPDADFYTECGNRLWCCRYGYSASTGGTVNEIYASKQGDFKNFYCYEGISTDSYAASLGCEGTFTGACSFLGRPLFFKEDCAVTVYGAMPSEYRTVTMNFPSLGVESGSSRSIACVRGRLYYKSPSGICVYSGVFPLIVSKKLGGECFTEAVGGTFGDCYYISMLSGESERVTYVYDVGRELWLRESGGVTAFAMADGRLWMLEGDRLVKSEGDEVSWSATISPLAFEYRGSAYLKRVRLALSLESGAQADVYVAYAKDEWERVGSICESGAQGFTVTPRRCEKLWIRVSGRGKARLVSLTKYLERGSDGNV